MFRLAAAIGAAFVTHVEASGRLFLFLLRVRRVTVTDLPPFRDGFIEVLNYLLLDAAERLAQSRKARNWNFVTPLHRATGRIEPFPFAPFQFRLLGSRALIGAFGLYGPVQTISLARLSFASC